MNEILKKPLFWLGLALLISMATPSPVIGLCLGAFLGLTAGNPARNSTSKMGTYLLQFAVILLGFGLQFGVVLKVGFTSLGLTLVSITGTLLLGCLLGKLIGVEKDLRVLLSGGTAICGGSAIAAIAPSIGASAATTAVALAVIFLLNGIALLVFPFVGHLLHLTQGQFGLWAALAIHDTSSVVGAGAAYGMEALALATTVKLTRALWILPVSFFAARLYRHKSGAKVPWFLFGFLLAALARSLFPAIDPIWSNLAFTGKQLMAGTLFLVGAALTREDLQQAGGRPLAQAFMLWVLVAGISLVTIKFGGLHLTLPI